MTTDPDPVRVAIKEVERFVGGVQRVVLEFEDDRPEAELFTRQHLRHFGCLMDHLLRFDDHALYLGEVQVASIGEAKSVQFFLKTIADVLSPQRN